MKKHLNVLVVLVLGMVLMSGCNSDESEALEKLDQLEQQLQDIKTQIEQLKVEVVNVTDQYLSAQKEIETLNQTLQERQEEIEYLQQQIDNIPAHFDRIQIDDEIPSAPRNVMLKYIESLYSGNKEALIETLYQTGEDEPSSLLYEGLWEQRHKVIMVHEMKVSNLHDDAVPLSKQIAIELDIEYKDGTRIDPVFILTNDSGEWKIFSDR